MDITDIQLNQTQYGLLRHYSETGNMEEWRQWRSKHPKTSIRLVGADFADAKLELADLRDADLRAANLQSATLAGANLRKAKLDGALLFQADMSHADLRGASLYGADLNGVNLKGANLFDADLTKADLRGAKISGLRLQSKMVLEDLAHPLSDQQIASILFAEEALEKSKVMVVRENRYREAPADTHTGEAPLPHRNFRIPVHDERETQSRIPSHGGTAIVRTVPFDFENLQAGIGILNYFSEILRLKYEGHKAKIIIAQEGLDVRLTIETVEREKRIIEKTLEEYIAVVTGRRPIADFLPEPLAGLALKQKLDLIDLELRQTAALHSYHQSSETRCDAIPEPDIQKLHRLLSGHICISRL